MAAKDWRSYWERSIENHNKTIDYELKWPIKGKYDPKGDYITVDGMKTYRVGEQETGIADKGIITIYDIFGFQPNTLQGADILSQYPFLAPKQHFKIFMPDFFQGNTMQLSWTLPTASDEDKAKAANWWATQGNPAKTVERMPRVLEELKRLHPEIRSWGILGFCWGGKVVSLVTKKEGLLKGSLFNSAAMAHPAFPLPGKAEEVGTPLLILPTKGEKKEVVDEWVKGLKVKNDVMRFDDQNHGFMAAKGDLNDPNVADGYYKGYIALLYWFYETL